MTSEIKPASKRKKAILLIVLLVLIPGAIFLGVGSKNHYTTLPYIGEREVNGPGDTTYFTVPPFHFIDEDGKPFSDKDTQGKILIVDFFFTRCTSICPRMSAQMQQLQLQLDKPRYDDVLFLSHTVDPEHDTPEVLKEYARGLQADPKRWKFLTGNAPDIYRQGNLGYLLTANADSAAAEMFVHSPQFVLVDKQRHIRGMYDGTNTDAMRDLVVDLKALQMEEERMAHGIPKER
ncbi:MAG: SCO family protein [Flavobacteriales bacterium]|nr:SCO family protein [Flavobacteriales bacterium]MEB2342497.1 SCO family protein [Flavobacteriia bacterium]